MHTKRTIFDYCTLFFNYIIVRHRLFLLNLAEAVRFELTEDIIVRETNLSSALKAAGILADGFFVVEPKISYPIRER